MANRVHLRGGKVVLRGGKVLAGDCDCPCDGCPCSPPSLYLTVTGLFGSPYVVQVTSLVPCTWFGEFLEDGFTISGSVVLETDGTFTVSFAIIFFSDSGDCFYGWADGGDIMGDCDNLAGSWTSQILAGAGGCPDYTVDFLLSQTP